MKFRRSPGYRLAMMSFLTCLGTVARIDATSIVVVQTGTKAVIAADSKRTSLIDQTTLTSCKIYHSGKIYFAVASLSVVGWPKTRQILYDAPEVAAGIAKRSRSVKEAAEIFEKAMTPKQTGLLRSANRQRADGLYSQLVAAGPLLLGVVFVSNSGGTPAYSVRQYVWTFDNKHDLVLRPVHRAYCPGNCPPVRLGDNTATRDALAREIIGSKGEVAGATELVQREIALHPEDVGPPIAVLVLDRKGAHWPNGEGVCKDH